MTYDPNRPSSTEPAPGMPVVRIQPRKASSMWLNVVLGLATLVAVGGIAFAIGRGTAPAAIGGPGGPGGPGGGNFPGLGGNFPGGSFAPDASGGLGGGFARGGGFNLSGTVESITDDTLMLKTANGQTLEFSLGADTTYASKTPATAADVKAGSKVEVQLRAGGIGQPQASADASGPAGTASSVTVVP